MQGTSTKEHLLQVGLRQIHQLGYASTGIKELLEEAKIPKGSFYHYFVSKEAFVEEVLKLYSHQEMERCNRFLKGRGQPLVRLRRYFEELVESYGQNAPVSGCLIGNLSLELADHSHSIQLLLKSSFAIWQSSILEVVQEAMEKGEIARFARPDELAGFLLNNYQGALLRAKAERSNKPLENFLFFAFQVLLKKEIQGRRRSPLQKSAA